MTSAADGGSDGPCCDRYPVAGMTMFGVPYTDGPAMDLRKRPSLEGYAGSVLGVCGANGAGKSTFAQAAGRCRNPDGRCDHCDRVSASGPQCGRG